MSNEKYKLLWLGDAVEKTGFARVTHGVLEHLKRTWDVTVLGINYSGDPHEYDYPIYPAGGLRAGRFDVLGMERLEGIVQKVEPDILMLFQDFWNVSFYLEGPLQNHFLPTVAYLPVDGKNMRQDWVKSLNQLDEAIFYTHFGLNEARRHGLETEASVIPHGVDLKRFFPIDRLEAREALNFPEHLQEAFIFGNVGRNAPRKRLDLTVRYFADLINKYDVDAYLLFLCWRDDPDGWNLPQLGLEFGIPEGRMIFWEDAPGYATARDEYMPYIYSAMDVHLSTTGGEGWGLPQLEAMACGVPNICPDWSALGEWAKNAARLVPCTTELVASRHWNTIQGIADRELYIQAMLELYHDEAERSHWAQQGFDLVQKPQFRWENVAKEFDAVFRRVLEPGTETEFNQDLVAKMTALESAAALEGVENVA